jgi:hypothetical protein
VEVLAQTLKVKANLDFLFNPQGEKHEVFTIIIFSGIPQLSLAILHICQRITLLN